MRRVDEVLIWCDFAPVVRSCPLIRTQVPGTVRLGLILGGDRPNRCPVADIASRASPRLAGTRRGAIRRPGCACCTTRAIWWNTTGNRIPRLHDRDRFATCAGGPPSMAMPLATPATTESSTLYFGPWYRRSPFFEKTLEAGCSAYDIYNHMYLPGYYADPVEEYWALLNDVTLWDVSVERIVEITGPDASAFVNTLDLSRPDEVRGRPGQVRADHRRGRRHRQRPGAAAGRGRPLVAGAGRLGRRAVGARRRHPQRHGRQGARTGGLSGPGPGPQVEGHARLAVRRPRSSTSSTTGR